MEFRLEPIPIEETEPAIYLPLFTVPEGPGLLNSDDVNAMNSLLLKLIDGIAKTVFSYVQHSTKPLIVSGGNVY